MARINTSEPQEQVAWTPKYPWFTGLADICEALELEIERYSELYRDNKMYADGFKVRAANHLIGYLGLAEAIGQIEECVKRIRESAPKSHKFLMVCVDKRFPESEGCTAYWQRGNLDIEKMRSTIDFFSQNPVARMYKSDDGKMVWRFYPTEQFAATPRMEAAK